MSVCWELEGGGSTTCLKAPTKWNQPQLTHVSKAEISNPLPSLAKRATPPFPLRGPRVSSMIVFHDWRSGASPSRSLHVTSHLWLFLPLLSFKFNLQGVTPSMLRSVKLSSNDVVERKHHNLWLVTYDIWAFGVEKYW